MNFKLLRASSVLRLDDGAIIPSDDGNLDWRAYQAWLAAGNVPLPRDPDLTPDQIAAGYADGADKVQFRLLFNLENRVRVLEGKLPVTAAQYRQAVIDLWKTLNP